MKKVLLIVLSLSLVVTSCKSDELYENLNRDPKNPTQVAADFLYNSATKSLIDQVTSTNVNRNIYRLLAQYWTQTTYTDESNYDFVTRNIPQYHWSETYRDVLLDLKTSVEVVNNDEALSQSEKDARNAQAEILMIYAWQHLVDSFGDIPYSEALGEETLPAYDDAATIYTDLINRINAAIPNLSGSGYSSVDQLYGGDSASWVKFANSLKLRLGIRLTDVNPSLAQSTVESAVSGGVFTSNADNATIHYMSSTPNTNPLWVDLVQSGRADFVAANTIVDIMNNIDDPRRSEYFDQNLGSGVYTGGAYGDNNSFPNFTHIRGKDDNTYMHDPTFAANLLDFSEVSFYLAEAAERGYTVGGTAEEHYNNGIAASFEAWGSSDLATYMANPDVAYSTAPGTWKEKIGLQFWLAMYNRGFEGWTVWRKFDTPDLNIPVVSGSPVPTRYTYPVNEQNLNEANWEAASSAIGGDTQTTKLFWDVD
ncbi:SusD/RagB family nutrient-binding outer membrane lipoprotein [Hwangdonia lutea]|uniref:SusD/RagB family nutrient-binding outer membrane lipoprotein n=1 Tax=Hwangdonia lutea TaxID=3075823 RepID=A0AA97EJ76_9FLAO|nr:SusD/RagB family nutrient-binding outer membrane lipoprotein [Hwangdonia sp. SCSIO 19198]WOD42222.1 SusD/RagB family nutrient-binding outer membrane lipoprotein [Hwangdonia sp. SCSIO 19198]